MDHIHNLPMDDNPYYMYFRDMHGTGGIGEVYNNQPEFERGYGVISRNDGFGGRVQLGSGIRSWFGNVYQFAKPYLKKGIKAALNFGTQVVHDILDGESATSAVKKRVKEVAKKTLPTPVSNFVDQTVGSGLRKISGGRKKKRTVKKRVTKKKKYSRKFSALNLIPE